jgi:hypothetical protein
VAIEGCHQVKALKAKKLTRAQQLKRALASCRKRFRHSRGRRRSCEAKAHKTYGAHAARKGKQAQKAGHPKEQSRQGLGMRGERKGNAKGTHTHA